MFPMRQLQAYVTIIGQFGPGPWLQPCAELSHALRCSFLCADQVGVTWWCGTVAHQAFSANSVRLRLQPGITQLFMQPLPLLDSSSSTGYQNQPNKEESQTNRSTGRKKHCLLGRLTSKPPVMSKDWVFMMEQHKSAFHKGNRLITSIVASDSQHMGK